MVFIKEKSQIFVFKYIYYVNENILINETRCLWAFADNECPDQTLHLRSLIRAFAGSL